MWKQQNIYISCQGKISGTFYGPKVITLCEINQLKIVKYDALMYGCFGYIIAHEHMLSCWKLHAPFCNFV